MTEPVLAVALSGVSVGYGAHVVLEDIDLRISTGSLVAVIGPNGAGKSTLLKAIAGALKPMAGTVEVLGAAAARNARRIAYVPQAELVDRGFPVSVGDVVMMGRVARIGIGRRPGRADRVAVDAALETVGMLDLRDRQIGRLSGGQRRRAFLGRAIASEPEIYLLDEPMTGVDVPTTEDLAAILAAEADRGRTVIATTHDLASATRHFRDVVFLNRRVVAAGPAALALDPELLAATYGSHIVMLAQGQGAILDDAHHHLDRAVRR